MRAERPTVLVVPRRVKVVMISTLQRLSSVTHSDTRLLLRAYQSV